MNKMYKDINSEIIIIPGGCKTYLQPLDAKVINSFKNHCEINRIEEERELLG